jgi:TolB protein
MRRALRRASPVLFVTAVVIALVLGPGVQRPERVVRRERESRITIHAGQGGLPRLSRSPFVADGQSPDLEAVAATLGDVLWADLGYEDVFDLLPVTPPGEKPPAADGVVSGRVRLEDGAVHLEVRIREATGRQLAFAREYVGPEAAARQVAHVAADEILRDQAGIQGLAASRLAFVSDRLGAFKDPTGSPRRVKEIFVSDYDGANQRRVTTDGDLDLTPSWSPDGRFLAYTSYRRGFQDIFVTDLGTRRQSSPTLGRGPNWLPAWSPDGKQIAFTSTRDGNSEIYVMNADGTACRRLTTNWAIDTSPAWSPDGKQIAFTSNRTGSPQIWVMDADGSNPRAVTTEKYCDRPTWSPGPVDEIAYVSQTRTGFDIEVIDMGTRRVRQLTFGLGNESPAFSPNGRHIAFTSTRSGTQQIWTMTRLGTELRQVTKVGNNSMASWSRSR